MFTDCEYLYKAAYTLTDVREKRLRINMAAIREDIQNKRIEGLYWIDTKHQIADGLTKPKTDDCLQKLLKTGAIENYAYYEASLRKGKFKEQQKGE